MFMRNPRPFFQRQKAERLIHDPMGDVSLLYAEGGYHVPAWERQPMPDAGGAGTYAYLGLALPPTSLYGGGYAYAVTNWITPPMVQQGTTLPTAYNNYAATPGTSPLYDPTALGS